MAATTLEERVAALEKKLADLAAVVDRIAPPRDWQSTIGMFSGDEVMKRIFDTGQKIREAERRKARQQNGKRQRKRA